MIVSTPLNFLRICLHLKEISTRHKAPTLAEEKLESMTWPLRTMVQPWNVNGTEREKQNTKGIFIVFPPIHLKKVIPTAR